MKGIFFFFTVLALSGVLPEARAQDPFIELKGTHFVVRYISADEREEAQQVLLVAEQAYEQVSRNIGFERFGDFWTWEKRVKITLFPDKISYSRFTGQAQWSKGYASRESRFFTDRVIVTYSGQPEMAGQIIPHEVSHLVFWDLLGGNYRLAPVWLEEGVAQLAETGKRSMIREVMMPVVAAGRHIPFTVFNGLKPSGMTDDAQVGIFYAQSLSVVVFLIEKYGQDSFYRLCKELRDGHSLEESLGRVYGGVFASMATLEARWLEYMTGQ